MRDQIKRLASQILQEFNETREGRWYKDGYTWLFECWTGLPAKNQNRLLGGVMVDGDYRSWVANGTDRKRLAIGTVLGPVFWRWYGVAPSTEVALQLYFVLIAVAFGTDGDSEAIRKSWDRENQIKERLVHLGPLRKRNGRHYAHLAKPLFCRIYGRDFQNRRVFKDYRDKVGRSELVAGNWMTPPLFSTPYDLRNAIWHDVIQSFRTIAPRW